MTVVLYVWNEIPYCDDMCHGAFSPWALPLHEENRNSFLTSDVTFVNVETHFYRTPSHLHGNTKRRAFIAHPCVDEMDLLEANRFCCTSSRFTHPPVWICAELIFFFFFLFSKVAFSRPMKDSFALHPVNWMEIFINNVTSN
jgi:hypothetical protein